MIDLSVTQIAGQTEIKPMSKTNVGANLIAPTLVLLIGLISV